jgi:hypothetical protein
MCHHHERAEAAVFHQIDPTGETVDLRTAPRHREQDRRAVQRGDVVGAVCVFIEMAGIGDDLTTDLLLDAIYLPITPVHRRPHESGARMNSPRHDDGENETTASPQLSHARRNRVLATPVRHTTSARVCSTWLKYIKPPTSNTITTTALMPRLDQSMLAEPRSARRNPSITPTIGLRP